MNKSIVWLVVSCLMVLSLVLASCAPAVAPEKEKVTPGKEAAKEEVTPGAEMVKDVLGRLVEKPRYGGTFTWCITSSPYSWDPATPSTAAVPLQLIYDSILSLDWVRGPSGTNEVEFVQSVMPTPDTMVPDLAESWELTDNETTLVFHIRHGVRFQSKPPVNGRELTAEDVVYTFRRNWGTPGGYLCDSYPVKMHFQGTLEEAIYARDKWTVVFKCQPGMTASVLQMLIYGAYSNVYPREVVEKYGGMKMQDWPYYCGSGPFMMEDYVPDSAWSVVRNPNYWKKHPFFPDDQMPYMDRIRAVIIPDASTRLAGLRAHKIDWLGAESGVEAILYEDAKSLIRSNPDLKYQKYPMGYSYRIYMRVDTKPFDDVRVRRALQLAIDQIEMGETLYSGEYELVEYPICASIAQYKNMVIPLEEMSPSIRELFEYHPDKAKQLLADAGYPNGFKTNVLCVAANVDFLSVVSEYWKKIGVDLEIIVKESAVFTTLTYTKKEYTQMCFASSSVPAVPVKYHDLRVGQPFNRSIVNDPVIEKAFADCMAAYFQPEKMAQVYKAALPHIYEQVYVVQFPKPFFYLFWQPWVKGHAGEMRLLYTRGQKQFVYYWIDQDLKEKLIGTR